MAQAAQQQGFPQAEKLLIELLALLVVVTVLESAMSTIFQWRVYRMIFNARAVKTIVMVTAGWAVATYFDYDVFSRILALTGVDPAPVGSDGLALRSGWFSKFMSALVLAGGSAGINNLLKSFGFRSPVAEESAAPPLKEDEAWISITVRRARAVGAVHVHVDETVADHQPLPALLGVLDNRSTFAGSWR